MNSVSALIGSRARVHMFFISVRHKLDHGLLHTAIALLVGQVSNAVIGAAIWLVATHFYAVDVLGQSSALIGAASFIANASLLGLDYTVIRHLPTIPRAHQPGFLGAAFSAGSVLALILGLVALPFVLPKGPLGSSFGIAAIAASIVLGSMLVTIGLIGDAVLLTIGRPGSIVTKNVLSGLARLILVFAFARATYQAPLYTAYMLSWLLAVALLAFFIRRPPTTYRIALSMHGFRILGGLWSYAGLSYLSTMLDNASMSLLPLLILRMTDASNAGTYQIVWLIASMLFIMPTTIGRALFSHQSNETTNEQDSRRLLRTTLPLAIALAVPIILFSPQLLQVLGPVYTHGAGALRWFVASLPVITYGSVPAVRVRVRGHISWLVVNSGMFLGIMFLGVSLLLPVLGLTGVGVAWFTGQVVAAILITIASRIATQTPLDGTVHREDVRE